jgi:adenylate cyclase
MDEQNIKRHLTAILSADVEGYSRLMQLDEVGTVRTLTAYRNLMVDRVRRHRGRVVDSPGDNILAQFGSVLAAVACAVEVQRELERENADLPPEKRMRFRMGINLGDVIEDEERIYGDGVNIAARLEGLAEGGGICISGSAFEQVRNKVDLGFEYLGRQTVKNITEPVRVYRVLMDPEAAGNLRYRKRRDDPGHKRKTLRAVSAAVCILAIAIVAVKLTHEPPRHPRFLKQKLLELSLPDVPSVAVLPFTNMGEDSEEDYFSDGMTDDLITDLSKVSGLFVISRNSVFAYKDRNVKIEEIGRELGVRYVLEGSVRRAGDRVRINAQLIDTATGGHVWAERYDRQLEDIFALQDEVREKIVSALAVQLTREDRERLVDRGTRNLQAYDHYLRAQELLSRKTQEGVEQARALLEEAVDLDPEYAEAYAALGYTHLAELIFAWTDDPEALDRARALGEKALAVQGSNCAAHTLLGQVHLWEKRHDEAIAEIRQAVSLEPNAAQWHAALGEVLTWAGRPEEALEHLERALRLDPKYPAWYLWNVGHALYLMGDYDSAVEALDRALTRNESFWPSHVYLALSYSALGLEEKAVASFREALRFVPNPSPGAWNDRLERLPYRDRETAESVVLDMKRLLEKAGGDRGRNT